MAAKLQPEQSYYPSARVRLIVRLEDYGAPNTPKVPDRPSVNRRGVADSGSTKNLQVVQVGNGFELLGPGDAPGQTSGPQDQTTSDDGLTHVIDGIIPLTARHDRNGIRVADQLKFDVQFLNLPIDPRTIRACAVKYFVGTVNADDFSRGIAGELRQDATTGGLSLPYNVIPDSFVDRAGVTRSNLRFEGFVDVLRIEASDDGAPVLAFECTDNTRILIEQEAPPALAIDPKIRIDQAIANYLAAFPQCRGFSVEYRPKVQPSQIPVLGTSLGRTAYPPKQGPTPAGMGAGGGTMGAQKVAVWDYLTDVAGAVGHTIRVEGTTVVIQRARTLYAQGFNSRSDDPFTGRTLPDGTQIRNRTFVYGENVKTFDLERHFTKNAPFNVEVRSYLGTRKKTLVVRYPEKADRQKKLAPGQNADQKFQVIRVSGIFDLKVLRLIAQGTYESWGRNEVIATVLSKNLGSLGGDNLDPDILDAVPGDTIDVLTLPPSEDSGLNTVLVVAEESAAAQRLIDLGFDPAFAAAYARAFSTIGFPHTFRTRSLSTQWDHETGIAIEIGCMNYVEVRADAELPPSEEITPEESDAARPLQPVTVEDLQQ